MRRLMAVLLVLAMALSLAACGTTGGKVENEVKAGDSVLAKVNDQTVSLQTFEKGFAIVERNYIEQYGKDIFSQEMGGKTLGELIKIEFMNNMILSILKTDYVKAAGKSVDAAKVDENYTKYFEAELKEDPSLSEEDKAARAEKRTFYEEQGIDEAFIKSQIESQMYDELFYETLREQSKDQLVIDDATLDAAVSKVSARHILVATKEEADAIIKRIGAGEAFEELAKTLSTDTGSGAQGGDLGFFSRGMMVESFETAAFSLPVGQLSEPIQSQFGYHIIRVDKIETVADMKAASAPTEEIEAVRDYLVQVAFDKIYQDKVEALLGEAKIERHEELLQAPAKAN